MTAAERTELIKTLKSRFEKNKRRHPEIDWATVEGKLDKSPDALKVVHAMEASGGEPDVIAHKDWKGLAFCDCSPESPSGRRSLCFDQAALDSRKANKPSGSALGMAATIGVEVLTEEQYRVLQELGDFDTKTSSWVATPADVRSLGGALFCDRRFGKVFVYHNGAESYYAGRAFRGLVRI